ncbi:MAG TPA: MFS transporter [Chryseolinea sp.]|nr:MFS transporter [Chryseolinea sp.]
MTKRFPVRYLVVIVTFTLTVLLYVDRACISAAKDDITSALGLNMTEFGWIMAVFTLGYALFQTISGRFADHVGARVSITSIVSIWSVLTALTAAAWSFSSILIIRFLFGAGEAGAFPSLSKVIYTWFPTSERGIVQGINFSGSRIGAAFALPVVAGLVDSIGWRYTFVFFGIFGVIFSIFWFLWFRDRPESHSMVQIAERDHIISTRQSSSLIVKPGKLSMSRILGSKNMWFIMVQYVCCNFTFYFTLTWMYSYIRETYDLGDLEAGLYSAVPLIAGAVGNWISGAWLDSIYKKGQLKLSRQIPAIVGFALASVGMLMVSQQTTAITAIIFLSIAVLGADMTLSPSWAFCIDIGKEHSATVSGVMNMAGNLGAFVTIIAFPYLLKWTGSPFSFFIVSAALGLIAIIMWLLMNPHRAIEEKPELITQACIWH